MAPKPNIYISEAHSGPYFNLHWPPCHPSQFFWQYFKQQCWAPKRYIQKGNCYLIRPCIIRHGNSIMFPAQLIQTARAINYIKTFCHVSLINQDVGSRDQISPGCWWLVDGLPPWWHTYWCVINSTIWSSLVIREWFVIGSLHWCPLTYNKTGCFIGKT